MVDGWALLPMQGCFFPTSTTIQMNLPKTDADDRTHENDADSLSRQKFNASFWGNAL